MTATVPSHPPIRRVVTGHSEDGKAIFLDDAPLPSRLFSPTSTGRCTELFRTEEFPADNGLDFDDIARKDGVRGLTSEGGSAFWSFEIAPRGVSPFHRTVSLDYGIVMKGPIILELDDGVRKEFKTGDVIVQRGTAHAWINETDEWTQVYFIVLPSNKVKIGDKELQYEFPIKR